MTAGYSKRPLVKKLGVKEGWRVCLLDAPANYVRRLEPLPARVSVSNQLRGTKEFIQFFCRQPKRLASRLPALERALDPNGMLWISWPKKSSGEATDLTGDVVRGFGLQQGLVDVKVCAIDDVWSGLKFVFRLKDRTREGSSK